VWPGQVYKLYTQQKEESLSEYMMPEMLRSGFTFIKIIKKCVFRGGEPRPVHDAGNAQVMFYTLYKL
jgi:hypothetical protein